MSEKQLQDLLDIANNKIKDEKDLTKIISSTSKLAFFIMINKKYKNSSIQKLFCQSMKVVKLNPFQIVFKKDDYGDKFFLILSGSVSIINKVKTSTFQINKTLEKGQYFGELALINNTKRSATVKIGGVETILGYIDKQAFNIIFKNNYEDIFLQPYQIINNCFIDHWNKYKQRMFYSSSFIIQVVQQQILLEKSSSNADGILIVLNGEIQMYYIQEQTGEEIPLTILRQNDIVNEEQFIANQLPLYTTRCLSQTAQLLYINKDEFVTKILSDKITYTKIIKQIENKQSIIKIKQDKIKQNGIINSQKTSTSNNSNNNSQEEQLLDNYQSPNFKSIDPKENIIQKSYDEINEDEQLLLKIRNSSFFEISFSDDHFQNNIIEQEIQQSSRSDNNTADFNSRNYNEYNKNNQSNFYDLESEGASYHSLSSNLSSSENSNSSQRSIDTFHSENKNKMTSFPFKSNETFGFRDMQIDNKLETIRECLDEFRSSENFYLQTIPNEEKDNQDELYEEEEEKKQEDNNNTSSNKKENGKIGNLFQYIEGRELTEMYNNNNNDNLNNYQERLENPFDIKQFEKNILQNNTQIPLEIQQNSINIQSNNNKNSFVNIKNYISDSQLQNDQFSQSSKVSIKNFITNQISAQKLNHQQGFNSTQEINSNHNLNLKGKRNNIMMDSEEFLDQTSSDRQDSLFDVSKEGIQTTEGQEDGYIIHKDQLVQANITRKRQIMGQIGSTTCSNENSQFQSEKNSRKNSVKSSPGTSQTVQNLNKDNKIFSDAHLRINPNKINNEQIEHLSPLKGRYLENIKNKKLSNSNGSSLQTSPVRKSLNSYKMILSNKLNSLNQIESEEYEKNNGKNDNQIIIQENHISIKQQQLGSNNQLSNSNPLFMSPVEQKFTLSTQISPRISSCQDMGYKVTEEQFNFSQVSQNNGINLLSNSGVQNLQTKENNSSQKKHLINSQNKDESMKQISEIDDNSNQKNIKRNSILTTSNESELNEDLTTNSLHLSKKKNSNTQNDQQQQYQSLQQFQIQPNKINQNLFNISPQKIHQIEFTINNNTPTTTGNKQIKENKQQNNQIIKNAIHQNTNNKDQIPIQIVIPPIKQIENQEKLTQQQKQTLEKFYRTPSSYKDTLTTESFIDNLSNLNLQQYVVKTEEIQEDTSPTKKNINKQLTNHSDNYQKNNESNNNKNGLNYLRINISKLKKTNRKQITQQNSCLMNTIFGKSLQEQNSKIKEDNSPMTVKNNSNSSNQQQKLNERKSSLAQVNPSKDQISSIIHHRPVKQSAAEAFKKIPEKLKSNVRSKSSLNGNDKIISFTEMYNVYKNGIAKNGNYQIPNNRQISLPKNDQKSQDLNTSKNQDQKTKQNQTNQLNMLNSNQLHIQNLMFQKDDANIKQFSKEPSLSKDSTPSNNSKELSRKNSAHLIKRKDILQGSFFNNNTKKIDSNYSSQTNSPSRKIINLQSSSNNNNNTRNTLNQQNINNQVKSSQAIRRQTNPDIYLTKNDKLGQYQTFCSSKPKQLLSKDFQSNSNLFNRLPQKHEIQSHSLDSSFNKIMITQTTDKNQNNQIQNPKIYTSFLSCLNDDPQQQQQQQEQSLFEQLQQNRRNSGIQNIKKLIYTQIKESNNIAEQRINYQTHEPKYQQLQLQQQQQQQQSQSQTNMIKQIYSKRYSQIF